jgi:hypothetical protein
MFPPDANAYRQQLMRVSRKIQDFKETSCQLRTLSQEQTALESELRGFESNLLKYESVTGSFDKPTSGAFTLSILRRVTFATGMRVYRFVMHMC